MAFGAHEEVGHGGHFLGAMHTMERFRTCFYRPMLSSSDNYERWIRNGGNDTNTRATKIYKEKLEEYEPRPWRGIREELRSTSSVVAPSSATDADPSPFSKTRVSCCTLDGSAEDDGLVAVEQHPGLGVPAHGAGEHLALDVAAGGGELRGVVGVVDAHDVLLDDRALVEVAR